MVIRFPLNAKFF